MKRRIARPLFAAVVIGVVGLTAQVVAALGPRVPDPIPELIAPGDVTVGLETVADGLLNPVGGVAAPGDKKHLYVVEQNGKIWSLDVHDDDAGEPRLFADLGAVGLNLGCFFINYDERGLFGVAFHPNYRRNGLLYTFQSQPAAGTPNRPANQCGVTVPDHDNVVTEWHVKRPRSSRATVDPTSAREILRIPHPQFNCATYLSRVMPICRLTSRSSSDAAATARQSTRQRRLDS